MIPVCSPIQEPASFDVDCRQAGNNWLTIQSALPKRPADFWSPFRMDLRRGFQQRCGYYAMYIHDGQIDHYVSWKTCKDNNPQLAYEWSNFRFVDGALNSKKKTLDGAMLDPFEIQTGWFEIELPSLSLRVLNVPEDRRAQATLTLEKLELDQGARVLELRWEWYTAHRVDGLPIDLLKKFAPLIADAIIKWNNEGRGDLPIIARPSQDPFEDLA
jgi:hypothetical protein